MKTLGLYAIITIVVIGLTWGGWILFIKSLPPIKVEIVNQCCQQDTSKYNDTWETRDGCDLPVGCPK